MEKNTRILVPVDGSEGSERALAVAAELSMAYGAVLDILHVSYFDSTTDTEPEDSWLPEELMAPIGRETEKLLEKARSLVPAGVSVELHRRTGIPVEEIIAFSREHEDETVVIGGRGLGLVEGFLAGSVSQQLLERAPGTIVVVK